MSKLRKDPEKFGAFVYKPLIQLAGIEETAVRNEAVASIKKVTPPPDAKLFDLVAMHLAPPATSQRRYLDGGAGRPKRQAG